MPGFPFFGDGDVLLQRSEAEHLDLDIPDAVGEVGEGVSAVFARDGGHRFCASRGCDTGSGQGQAAVLYDPVQIGGREGSH